VQLNETTRVIGSVRLTGADASLVYAVTYLEETDAKGNVIKEVK